jgi:hypothetical protein
MIIYLRFKNPPLFAANEGEIYNILSPSLPYVIMQKLFLKHNNSYAQMQSSYISANAQFLLASYDKRSVTWAQ